MTKEELIRILTTYPGWEYQVGEFGGSNKMRLVYHGAELPPIPEIEALLGENLQYFGMPFIDDQSFPGLMTDYRIYPPSSWDANGDLSGLVPQRGD